MTPAEGTRVIAYVRVSTEEQAGSGAGLEAQRQLLTATAQLRGWQLVAIAEDAGHSAATMARPALQRALAQLDAGEADALAVAKLDRLSRSLLDFAGLMDRARKRGWALVALDLGVDTTTPAGEMMANVLAVFAHFERRRIAERTREAMAVKKAQGAYLGRPHAIPPDVQRLILQRRQAGASLQGICDELNHLRLPTPHGGQLWRPSSIRRAVRRGAGA